jgi:hypothetical protein
MPLRLRGCQDRRTQAHRQTLSHSPANVDRGKRPLRETGGGVLFVPSLGTDKKVAF